MSGGDVTARETVELAEPFLRRNDPEDCGCDVCTLRKGVSVLAVRLAEAEEARERADALLRHVVAAEKIERLPGDHAVNVALLSVDEYLAASRKEQSE